jgi:ABC-2 type transport system ATP-binding protein
VELRRRGKTVFFSTHILSDVETICDRVGMVLRGRLVAEGALEELLDGSIRAVELRCAGIGPALGSELRASATVVSEDGTVFTFPDVDTANAAARRILGSGGRILALQPIRENLEETFVRMAAADAEAAVARDGTTG